MNAVVKASLSPVYLTTPMAMDGMSCIATNDMAMSSCVTGPNHDLKFLAAELLSVPLYPCNPTGVKLEGISIHHPNAQSALGASTPKTKADELLERDIAFFTYQYRIPPDITISASLEKLLSDTMNFVAFECGICDPLIMNTNSSIYKAYLEWVRLMGFSIEKPPDTHEVEKLLDELTSFFEPYGITVKYDDDSSASYLRSDHVQYVLTVVKRLPPSFFNNPQLLREIHLFCPVSQEAKSAKAASSYEFLKKKVGLFPEVFFGSRRYFLGILLHELGHSNEARYFTNDDGAIHWLDEKMLSDDIETILDKTSGDSHIYVLDWGPGAKFNLKNARESYKEFLSELCLAYFVDGPGLRKHIISIDNPEAQTAYLGIYLEIRDRVFGGVQYDALGRPYGKDGKIIESLHPHAP